MSNGLSSEFFEQLLTYVLIDDTYLLANILSLPLVVYTPESIVTFASADAFSRLTRKYRILLSRKGAIRVEANIVETNTVSNEMESYLVEQHHIDSSGTRLGSERLRYFVRNAHGQAVVEMIEQLQDPFVFENCDHAC